VDPFGIRSAGGSEGGDEARWGLAVSGGFDVAGDADGGVAAGDLVAGEGAGGEVGVEGLEAHELGAAGVGFEVDAFEGGFVVGFEADEAVGAGGGVDGFGGAEDDDVAFLVEGGHGVADDAGGEGVGVVDVGGADVGVGDAGGVAEVGELGGVAGGDAVDEGDFDGEEAGEGRGCGGVWV